MIFPPHSMADDDYVDGGRRRDHPRARRGRARRATRIFAVVAVPLAVPRDDRDYATAPAGYIGLRSMGMIGVAERQISNLGLPLPAGSTLTVIDPVVDVVGLFEIQPGLLRINKDYGWLRAADVLAEGDPDLLADVAAGTHELIEARCEAWRLEESLWAEERRGTPTAEAGTLALVREQKERVRDLVERRKQLGFPVPDGCEALVDRVRGAHRRAPGASARAGWRRACLTPQTVGPPSQPRRRKTTPGTRRRPARARCRARRSSTSARATPAPCRRSSARRIRSGS